MSAERTVTVVLSPEFPAEAAGLVRAVSPRLRVVPLVAGSAPPGEAGAAEVLAWWDAAREDLAALVPHLPGLRWVQSPVAGIGDKRLHEVLGTGVTLTSAAGVYADMVAEHALMLMLVHYRRLPELLDQQRQGTWADLDSRPLEGLTLGIFGAGGIGRATARLARHFGMRTIGLHRGGETVPELDRTLAPAALTELLGGSDVLVLAAPLTADTRGVIDATALHAMRPGALLINVARGPLVVTDDLVRALQERWIAGAGLDVTDPEPLPPDHPLWHCPGTIITPHHANPTRSSGMAPVYRFCENLGRYLAGEPLIAVVDPARGY